MVSAFDKRVPTLAFTWGECMSDEKGRSSLLEGTRRVSLCLKMNSRATAFFPHCLLDAKLVWYKIKSWIFL